MKAIIPCAGYGTRMNLEPTESKEMLIDPITNEPIIKYHLDLCDTYGLDPVIITRPEKTDLIDYCTSAGAEIVLFANPPDEWPDSILASYYAWDATNILLLPDTRFEPTNIIQKIIDDLNSDIPLSIDWRYIETLSRVR